jgi:hypothetical protein
MVKEPVALATLEPRRATGQTSMAHPDCSLLDQVVSNPKYPKGCFDLGIEELERRYATELTDNDYIRISLREKAAT